MSRRALFTAMISARPVMITARLRTLSARPSRTALLVPAAILWICLAGCSAPFSDFQSARTVGKGNVEGTVQYSTVSFEGDKLQEQRGFQGGIGPDNLSLVFRPEVGIMSYIENLDDPFIHFGMGISLANTDKNRSDRSDQMNE